MPSIGGRRRAASATNNNNAGEVRPAKKQRLAFELSVPERPTEIGVVLVCGQGDVGQLGLGEDELERTRPALLPFSTIAVDIAAGGMHNLILTNVGEVFSFGCNDEGALGRDTSSEGSEFQPGLITLPDKAVKISAGDSHSACLLSDGRVFAWGSFRDSHGNMGLTLEGNKRTPIDLLPGVTCVDIASGADHLVILTNTGKVYTIGCAEQGQLGRVAMRSAGGEGRRGKTDLLQPEQVRILRAKAMDAIWATNYCTFMRESRSGNIYGFGLNNYCQLAVSQGNKSVDVVSVPRVTKIDDVKQIAGGQHHTLVLRNDGKCYTIGRHEYGRLGLGPDIKDAVDTLTMVKALEDHNIESIACGESQSFAITVEGKAYAWGMGSNNQLGLGSEDDLPEPALIESKHTKNKIIIRVASGGQHSIFLVKPDEKVDTPSDKTSSALKITTTANANTKPVAVVTAFDPATVATDAEDAVTTTTNITTTTVAANAEETNDADTNTISETNINSNGGTDIAALGLDDVTMEENVPTKI